MGELIFPFGKDQNPEQIQNDKKQACNGNFWPSNRFGIGQIPHQKRKCGRREVKRNGNGNRTDKAGAGKNFINRKRQFRLTKPAYPQKSKQE